MMKCLPNSYKVGLSCALIALMLSIVIAPAAIADTNNGSPFQTQASGGVKVVACDTKAYVDLDFIGQASAAILSDDSLWMWGSNGNGWLGDGGTACQTKPVKVLDNVKSVVVGEGHAAAVLNDGSLMMWGLNTSGQLGDGTTEFCVSPVKVLSDVSSVALGKTHTAAICKDGSLWMWGNNGYGQLGDGTTANRNSPVKVMDGVKAVSLGNLYTAAIRNDGSLFTWGLNEDRDSGDGDANGEGQLGDGTTTNRHSPTKVLDGVKNIALSEARCAAAISDNGVLWAWGDNRRGRIGDGSTVSRSSPVKVLQGVSSAVLSPAGYSSLSAAIKDDKSLWMWGGNSYGQVGNGTSSDQHLPVRVLGGVSSVAFGSMHVAAIGTDGSLWVWGANNRGQVGKDASDIQTTPKRVLANVSQIALSYQTTMAVLKDGNLMAWGLNENGQLGDGSTTNRSNPTQIAFPIDSAIVSGLSTQECTGKALQPKPVVKLGNTVLTEGADYTLDYRNNVNAGTATVVVNGAGIFSGSIEKEFAISQTELPAESAKLSKAKFTYSGKACEPAVTVNVNGNELTQGVDFKVSYKNNTGVGAAIAIVEGMGDWAGSLTLKFKVVQSTISSKDVSLSKSSVSYSGKNTKPEIVVDKGEGPLMDGRDYTVSYPKTSKKVGVYKVAVKGAGNYKGKVSKAYKIVPRSSAIKGAKVVKASAGALRVSWKKVKSQADGYELWVSTSEKFKDAYTNKVKIQAKSSAGKKCKHTLRNLGKGAKYYVKVRVYKKVAGKMYRSNWSKTKRVKGR